MTEQATPHPRYSRRDWLRHSLATLVVAGACLTAQVPAFARSRAALPGLADEPDTETFSPEVEARWKEGERLMRRGEYRAAVDHYARTADQFGAESAVASRALLLQARALLADDDAETAAAVLERLLTDFPEERDVPAAHVTLALARRAAGDYAGALSSLEQFEVLGGGTALGPYLPLQRAALYRLLEDPGNTLKAATAALTADGGGPRLARVEALEKAAEAHLRRGEQAAALDLYNQILELASTKGYKAEMLFNTATLARALGRRELAAERFRAIVVDYATEARAPGALRALKELGLDRTVSPYEAGLVLLNAARDYEGARDQFAQVPADHPQASAARFNLALARLRLGEDDQAVDDLIALSQADATWAGPALLRAGRVEEGRRRHAEADALYARLVLTDPTSDRIPEALLRSGLTRYLRKDLAGAVKAWEAALAPGRTLAPTLRAQVHFWHGKALAGLQPQGIQAPEARDAWTAAAVAAPDSYYAFRAKDLLAGVVSPLGRSAPRDLGALSLDPTAQKELTAFATARTKLTPEALTDELARLPALVRADALLSLGLRAEAGWEVEGLARTYAEAKDVARLGGLAEWAATRDLPHLTLQVGRQQREALGAGLLALPRALQRHVYPAGFGDLVFEAAAHEGVDPYLLLGMIRQESSFNPRAQSSARARGLTQVVPSTAQEIARKLGMADDFEESDLFKPGISLQFGAWYLARQIESYQGKLLPALAAYNAGAGNVNGWLWRWGDDPDVFVEQIPFVETNSYVRLVYENYRLYEQIYG